MKNSEPVQNKNKTIYIIDEYHQVNEIPSKIGKSITRVMQPKKDKEILNAKWFFRGSSWPKRYIAIKSSMPKAILVKNNSDVHI